MPRRLMLILLVVSGAASLALWFACRERHVDRAREFREALVALHRGELKKVARTIQSLEPSPKFAEHVHVLRAAVSLRSGDPAAALADLTAHRPEGELRAPVLLFVCEALYQLGQLTAAETAARQLIDEEPSNADAHRWLAAVYYDLSANNAAIAELGTVIALSPDDYRPRALLGLIYSDFEKYQDAGLQYRKALDLAPPLESRRNISRGLIKALVRSREYDAALRTVEREFESPPEDAELLALASECHWALGREREAQRLLHLAQGRSPDERQVLLLSARMQMETGVPGAAIEPLAQHLERDPHDFECRYRLALLYQRLGRPQDFERESARMLASQRLRQELSDLSDQAVEQPRNAEVRERIAAICDQLDNPGLARFYRQAAQACRQVPVHSLLPEFP